MKTEKIPLKEFRTLYVEKTLLNAESRSDVTTYDSMVKGVGYIADIEGFVILTHNHGRLYINIEALEPMLREMKNIGEDIRRWIREENIAGSSQETESQ